MNANDIAVIRKQYYKSVQSSAITDELYDALCKKTHNDPLTLAYKGAIEALKAKHAFNPYNKLKWLRKADETMKLAVSMDSDNFEIRFLRFSYQHYVTSFLGFSKEIKDDLDKMVLLIKERKTSQVDAQLLSNAIRFIIETDRCDKKQRMMLSSFIP
jgi:hypothetical protein